MKFLHFAFATSGSWFRQTSKRELVYRPTVACSDAVQFDVGGHKFTIQDEDIGKYPSSMLYQTTLFPEHHRCQAREEVKIDRDGRIFTHIYTYLQYGYLPRGRDGQIFLDAQTLKELEVEAKFYGLDALSAECTAVLYNTSSMGPDFQSYFAVSDFVENVLSEHRYRYELNNGLDYSNVNLSATLPLMHALECLWVPFCAVDRLCERTVDLNVHNIAPGLHFPSKLVASQVDATTLNATIVNVIISEIQDSNAFQRFAPHLNLTLQLKDLLLQRKGFSQDQRKILCPPRNTGHIGTLVVILNSEYTGGELEVTHGGRTEVVTGPYSWVAMYGDCLHKINPVTSGTRATLVFDIYGKNQRVKKGRLSHCFENYRHTHWAPPKEMDLVHALRPPSLTQQRAIKKHVNQALQDATGTSIIIGLQHQYHFNPLRLMPTVDMLIGGDRVLYEILTNSSDYVVKLVSVSLQEVSYNWNGRFCKAPTAKYFTLASLHNHSLSTMPQGTRQCNQWHWCCRVPSTKTGF